MIYVVCKGEKYNSNRSFRIEFKTRNVYRVQNLLADSSPYHLYALKGFFFV